MPQYIQFLVKPYLPSVPQNVNPRDGVAFSDLFGDVSKEKKVLLIAIHIHIYFFYNRYLSVKILIPSKRRTEV